jgi:hypothetical protein
MHLNRRHDPQHNDPRLNDTQNNSMATLSITTFSFTALTLKGQLATLNINDTQHSNTVIILNVIKPSVAFYLLLC